MYGQTVSMEVRLVRDRSGYTDMRPLREYNHTDGRTYVEGRRGSTYDLRLYNHTTGRVKTVVSVDGLSTLDGNPAGPNSPGFVIEPASELVVSGWTKNNNQAAAFEFADTRASYARESGQSTSNVGVIGALVYEEYHQPIIHKAPQWPQPQPFYGQWSPGVSPWETDASAMGARPISINHAASSSRGMSSGSNTKKFLGSSIGTGWGEDLDVNLVQTNFTAQSNYREMLAIFYDSAEGLRKRGIDVGSRSYTDTANPFPGMAPQVGCKPPRRYR